MPEPTDLIVTCPHCGKTHTVNASSPAPDQPSLFSPPTPKPKPAPAKPAPGNRSFILNFDGGSRGNPGPGGIGVVLSTDDGVGLYELGESLGRCTSNVAEYTALIRGLHAALAWQASKLLIRADSELVVRQLSGQYKVKSPDLRPLYEQAVDLMEQIPEVKVLHVYREDNKRCDALANAAMDKKGKLEPLGPLP